MKINRYQFDSIASKTKKTIKDPIQRGEENGFYYEYLQTLEVELYQFHVEYGINGRQAMEIIQVVLLDIESLLDGEEYDYSKWEEPCYRSCADEIEMFFMPDKNVHLQKDLKKGVVLDNKFYELAHKCLIRIHESVEFWTRKGGDNGYFNFIGEYIGTEILNERIPLVENEYFRD